MEPDLLYEILPNVASYTGQAFFDALSRELTAGCHVRFACVSEIMLDLNRARTISFYRDDKIQEQIEYDLTGTPCELVIENGAMVVERAVRQQFPNDPWLREVGAEAYAAVGLKSASGDTIGLVALLHDASLDDGAYLIRLLEGLATRLGTELERLQREDALHQSEERLRLLAEHTPDVLFYYQMVPEEDFKYINPSIEQLSGYPPEAFIANPDLALQIIHPDDRPQVSQAIATGSSKPITARLVRTDGEIRWIEYRTFTFHDAEQQVMAVCGTIRDITARVQALESLRLSEQYRSALLNAMPDTLLRLDADGTLLDYVSGEATRALNGSAGDLTRRNVTAVLPVGIATPILDVMKAAMQSKRLERIEFEVATASQSVTYEARCVPYGEHEALLILRDFTAMKWHKGEEDRARMRDELDVKVELQRSNPYSLTYREIAILHLIAEGQADKQIAESLGISIYTVNKHVGNILGKMSASSRTEAGVRAIREGLVS